MSLFFSYTGFKLIEFEVIDDPLFGTVKYEFIDDPKQNKIYTTVLIGPNGTLKSRVFQKLIEVFLALDDVKNEKLSYLAFNFRLLFTLDHSNWEISWGKVEEKDNSRFPIEGFKLRKNGKVETDFSNIKLPTIVATAIMLTDRYPFPDENRYPFYQYLGSRYRPQLASTKTFVGRVVEFISKNIDSEAFIKGVGIISREFLKSGAAPCITYHTQNTTRFFRGDLEPEEFYSYFNEIEEKYKNKTTTPPFKLNHYLKIKKDTQLTNEILQYCNSLRKNNELRDFPRSSIKAITFNLLDEGDVIKIRQHFYLLDHMRQLGIIYPAQIEFLKNVEENGGKKLVGYSIYDSSSGEHNLLGTMIGLIASVKPNSLIFIDEPEISLHPNWQMKFLSFVRQLFSDPIYSTCHIVVATHSHFLLSDLEGNNSSVIVLRRDSKTGALSAELQRGQNTFGWSPDDILYNIFEVVSSRNKFVAEDIADILDELSEGDKNQINKIHQDTYTTLLSLRDNLKDNDPLKEVVKSILTKVV